MANPLTNEHCACLDKVLQSYHPAMDLARKCEECGWDVTEIKNQIQSQYEMATKAKATFFPGAS